MATNTPLSKLDLLHAATAPTIDEAALRYLAQGLTVLPVLKGKKDSGLSGWQDLRLNAAQLRGYYRTGKYGGVAIRPGALSQNLVMLDCDGEPVYEAFCAAFPQLVDTYTELSGGLHGFHLFYQVERLPQPGTTKVNRKGIFGTDNLGFEIFYDSGQLVVAPSIHPSGNRYSVYKPLEVLRVPDLDAVLAWALSLETKQERDKKAREAAEAEHPLKVYTGVQAPRNGEIAPALVADIERALAVKGYQRNGWSKPVRCVLAHHEHDDERPAASWHGEKHIYSCLKCGETAMLAHELAAAIGLDVASYYEHRPQTVTKPTPIEPTAPAADIVLNQPYVDLPAQADGVTLLASDVATGKTQLGIREIGRAPRAIYLAHREKLAENLSRGAARRDVIVEHYKDLTRADRRRPARTAFCINSYAALASDAPGLPTADLLVLDEFEQTLEHVYGDAGTFNGQEAIHAGMALDFAIRTAKRVIVTDAHLGALAVDYIRDIRQDVTTVHNAHVTARGPLTIHNKKSGALAKGVALVEANEGVIAFAVGSVEQAKALAVELAHVVKDADRVLLLTAENADGERQRAFFADPNGQIGRYRAIVYSPVIGTGYDITTPVRAVIGVMGTHLSAYDARQMVGRCRNTRETHVYLPNTGGALVEDAEQIYADVLAKAERTSQKLSAAGMLVSSVPPEQLNYLKWHARVMARRNWSINRLRAHFAALSKGYELHYADQPDPELDARLKARREAIDAAQKELALTVEPVDGDTWNRLRDAGRADERAAAGFRRWKVEQTVGATITAELRDKLWTSAQRAAVRRFTEMVDEIAELRLADLQEANDGIPLPRRKHRTTRRRVAVDFINALTDADGAPVELERADLDERLQPLISRHAGDLKRLYGWRPDRCKSPAAIARRVCEAVGLKLDADQRGRARQRYYRLNQQALDEVKRLAALRLTMLRRKREEAGGVLKSAKSPVSQAHGTFEYMHDVGEGYTSPAAAAQLKYMLDALTKPLYEVGR